MSNALFIGWNRPVQGKESHALELFASASSYFDRKKKEGIIDSYEPVLLSSHGGSLNGFMLVRGDPDKMVKMNRDEEFLRLVTRSSIALTQFGTVEAHVGDDLVRMMKIYRESI